MYCALFCWRLIFSPFDYFFWLKTKIDLYFFDTPTIRKQHLVSFQGIRHRMKMTILFFVETLWFKWQFTVSLWREFLSIYSSMSYSVTLTYLLRMTTTATFVEGTSVLASDQDPTIIAERLRNILNEFTTYLKKWKNFYWQTYPTNWQNQKIGYPLDRSLNWKNI